MEIKWLYICGGFMYGNHVIEYYSIDEFISDKANPKLTQRIVSASLAETDLNWHLG